MGNFSLDSGNTEMVLSERRHRAHRRMWAAVNLRELAARWEWNDEDRDMVGSMLGLDEEMQWATAQTQQMN